MNILLEFYDVYTLQQLLNYLTEIASKHGYKRRKNPTLELYAKNDYSGVIHIFVCINKTTKVLSVKMTINTPDSVVWSSRCESGWDEVLHHNLESDSDLFTMPQIQVDMQGLSEEMEKGLLIGCIRSVITPEIISDQSGFVSMATLSRPSITEALDENQLKKFEIVSFLTGLTWPNLMDSIHKGKNSMTLITSTYAVAKESLEELIGCTTSAVSAQFGFSGILTKGNKELKDKLGALRDGSQSNAVLIGKDIVALKDLEEASDTNGGLLSRMISKLPKGQVLTIATRTQNIPGFGLWVFTNPMSSVLATQNSSYYLYAVKYDGTIRKIYVEIESKKITIKDEILN